MMPSCHQWVVSDFTYRVPVSHCVGSGGTKGHDAVLSLMGRLLEGILKKGVISSVCCLLTALLVRGTDGLLAEGCVMTVFG